jgi:hypothetical protein
VKYNSGRLADAINTAVIAAQVYANNEDGGTCNFDCAYLMVPGMREKQAKEIEAQCGVYLSLHTYRFQGRILQIIGGLSGQGLRRTKMAETMYASLQKDGIPAGMYMQAD